MISRLGQCEDETPLACDIAVIDAGAAGISIARALKDRGLSICLIESGDADHDPAVQDLAAGETVGQPYYELRDARLRFFTHTASYSATCSCRLTSQDGEHRGNDQAPECGAEQANPEGDPPEGVAIPAILF